MSQEDWDEIVLSLEKETSKVPILVGHLVGRLSCLSAMVLTSSDRVQPTFGMWILLDIALNILFPLQSNLRRHNSTNKSNTMLLHRLVEVIAWLLDVFEVDYWDDTGTHIVDTLDLPLEAREQAVPGCLNGGFIAGDETPLKFCESLWKG